MSELKNAINEFYRMISKRVSAEEAKIITTHKYGEEIAEFVSVNAVKAFIKPDVMKYADENFEIYCKTKEALNRYYNEENGRKGIVLFVIGQGYRVFASATLIENYDKSEYGDLCLKPSLNVSLKDGKAHIIVMGREYRQFSEKRSEIKQNHNPLPQIFRTEAYDGENSIRIKTLVPSYTVSDPEITSKF